MTKLDPATLGVLVNKLYWIAEEMNTYLVRSAFSTNIKVRKDSSCALYTRTGEMLAQGEFIPVHLGIMTQSLKRVLEDHPVDSLMEGDAIIHNDPFRMGSHLWDVMVFKPIFYDGKIVAFAGALAHHVDIGGCPPATPTRSIFEEGLRLPPVKIVKRGEIQEDIVNIIMTNSRTSREIRGDVMAQLAANYRAEQRMQELFRKYGTDTLLKYFDAILDYSEKGMRKVIGEMPDGEASFEDYVEHDGYKPNQIKIKASVAIKGTEIYIDFNGSGEPGEGSVNSPWSLTHSACYYAVKAIVGPRIPANAGAYRAIHIKRPDKETIVDAKFPHGVSTCTCTPAQRIADVVIGALSQIVPERVCACDGHWPVLRFVGRDPENGQFISYPETYACGRGAKHNDDGADAHQTHMTNTANAPVEVIELERMLKVTQYALVPDSGGAGKYRGGLGLTREVMCMMPASFAAERMRPSIKPYGLFGGEGGGTDAGGELLPDGSMGKAFGDLAMGGKACIRTSGGGGWGNSLERPIEKVEWDVLNGYISLEAAREIYGCVINPETKKANIEETIKLRNKPAAQEQGGKNKA